MSLGTNSLFKPTVPRQRVATVILVENSQTMSYIWSDLQDQYLNKLVDNLVVANRFAPLTVSVLESFTCGSNSSLPRQYTGYHDGLRDLKFNYAPENRISVGRVNSCIDLLDSGKFHGQTLASHLIIVAATTPSDENNGTYFPDNFSPWVHLAEKLAKKNVHCHIVASSHQDMTPLNMLFEETLRLQNRIEAIPPFTVDPAKVELRLSAQPTYGGYPDLAPSNSYPSQRIITSRRESYPLDNFYVEFDDASGPASSNETDPAPSLVSQLQQVHGLTKKKVYGTRPPRQPFFRDERFRDKYRNAPTPLIMPSSVIEEVPSPSAGGKVVSQSRADRMNRVGQASPTDLHSRRPLTWPRRGSGLSTPELEGISSSPASTSAVYDLSPGSTYVPSDMSSPVTPVTMTEESYNLAAGHVQNIPSSLPAYQIGAISEQSWPPQPHYHPGYHSLPQQQQYFPPQISNFYNTNSHATEHGDVQTLDQQRPPQSSQPPNSYTNYASTPILTPSIVSSQVYPKNDSPMAGVTASTGITPKDITMQPPKPSVRSAKKIVASEEDEERFMFDQEFVAATAALFEAEVLPAYPNYPGMSSGLTTSGNQGTLPYLAPSQAGELYASRVRRPGVQQQQQQQRQQQVASLPAAPAPLANVYPTNGMIMSSYSPTSYSTSYQPQSSSSLTGWAG